MWKLFLNDNSHTNDNRNEDYRQRHKFFTWNSHFHKTAAHVAAADFKLEVYQSRTYFKMLFEQLEHATCHLDSMYNSVYASSKILLSVCLDK